MCHWPCCASLTFRDLVEETSRLSLGSTPLFVRVGSSSLSGSPLYFWPKWCVVHEEKRVLSSFMSQSTIRTLITKGIGRLSLPGKWGAVWPTGSLLFGPGKCWLQEGNPKKLVSFADGEIFLWYCGARARSTQLFWNRSKGSSGRDRKFVFSAIPFIPLCLKDIQHTQVCTVTYLYCCGLNYVPPKWYVEVLSPSTSEGELFGDRVFTKVKMKMLGWHYSSRKWRSAETWPTPVWLASL